MPHLQSTVEHCTNLQVCFMFLMLYNYVWFTMPIYFTLMQCATLKQSVAETEMVMLS